MEFWEGAILVVGGIWLIGRMSRSQTGHPVNAYAPNPSQTVGQFQQTAGTIAGEPLGPAVQPWFPVPVRGTAMVGTTDAVPPINMIAVPGIMATPKPYPAAPAPTNYATNMQSGVGNRPAPMPLKNVNGDLPVETFGGVYTRF